jgi:hypothetical protein
MSVVVERGSARCPRCMVVVDYHFYESADGSFRYEVTCGACVNVYSEVSSPPSLDAPAA